MVPHGYGRKGKGGRRGDQAGLVQVLSLDKAANLEDAAKEARAELRQLRLHAVDFDEGDANGAYELHTSDSTARGTGDGKSPGSTRIFADGRR